jgi:Zn-dependent protease/CBS domain-containing protein
MAGAIGLFASILFHEFWHSWVARGYGMPMHGITLFLFGGVAEMHDEPPSPKVEFFVAIAGPVSSVVLGFGFLALEAVMVAMGFPAFVTAVPGYLSIINWVLAAFNMVPAFPLDGGRVLRAALWHFKGDLRQATRTATQSGGFFGIALMALGALSLLTGNVIGGLWYAVIGLFLRGSAQMAYKQLVLKQTLKGDKVSKLMSPDPVTVTPETTVRELVEDYFYKYNFKMFPVLSGGELAGCVHSKQIKGLGRERWDELRVADLMDHCSTDNTVRPDTDVMDAMTQMRRSGNSRLLVVDGEGKLRGVLSLKDLMSYLSLRMDVESDDD